MITGIITKLNMVIAYEKQAGDSRRNGIMMESLSRAILLFLIALGFYLSGCNSEGSVATTEEPQETTQEIASGSSSTPSLMEESETTSNDAQESPPTMTAGGESTEPLAMVTPTDDEQVQATAQDQPLTSTQIAPTPAPVETTPPPNAPVTSISLDLVTEGFEQPTYLTHATDERLFITEQSGRIWIILDGQKSSEPFLDIRQQVGSAALEQGLLSVAFHPNYSANGYFYVNYTDRAGDTVIARYQVSEANTNRADEESEMVVLAVNQPYANHNGGQIQFGPDGYLYIGMGDGGSAGDPGNNGQNPATLLGSMLRIDVDGPEPYSIPPDNPFTANNSARDETWATGLRNPWRFSFDRLNGDMYIADVGQNQWEEVNFQSFLDPGGANYGWKDLEGNHCYASEPCDTFGLVLPVTEYSQIEGGCSVTGGYIYQGTAYPSLKGNYFFGDYCSGIVWSLFRLPDGSWQTTKLTQIRANIASFGEDAAGEIYILDHFNGAIYQIKP